MTGRIPGLDGLRAVAVLLVLATHAGLERLLPGGFGVTLFFFISGWLITGQLSAELRRTGRIDLPGFYARRALRLLPAAAAYVIVAGGCFVAIGGHITPLGWLAALGYGANYYDLLARYHTDVAGVRHPFNILWSLAIEEHFYLLWPLLLAGLAPSGRAWRAVLALCLGALAWRAWLYQVDVGAAAWVSERLYKGSDTRIDSLAWGALASLLAGAWRHRHAAVVQGGLLALLAATLLIRAPWFRDVPRYTLQGVALFGLIPALLERDSAVRRLLETRPCVAIGRLSYSLYLWHWLAFGCADWLRPHDRLLWTAAALPLAALLSLASYAGIERPFLALRRRLGSRAPAGLLERPVQTSPARRKGFA